MISIITGENDVETESDAFFQMLYQKSFFFNLISFQMTSSSDAQTSYTIRKKVRKNLTFISTPLTHG